MTPLNPTSPPAWAYEQVHLVEHDPSWAQLAQSYAGEARSLLEGWLSGPVVHVGSTAIPGLAAKPIIDLQATATDPQAAVDAEHDAMAAASWFFVPRELDQRDWRWFVVRAGTSGRHRRAHLHLMRTDEPRWHDQIFFRDRLRESPTLALEYAELKAAAAAEHAHDREAYTEAKAEFVRRVLDQRS